MLRLQRAGIRGPPFPGLSVQRSGCSRFSAPELISCPLTAIVRARLWLPSSVRL